MAQKESALSVTQSLIGSECGVPLEDRDGLLRALVGRLPVMIYRCADDAQWTMEFVSAGAEVITGYKPGELVGNARLAYADLVTPWHCESVCRDIQAAIDKHNAWTTSYPIITASGQRKWVWERGVAVLDDDGRVCALEGVIVDMSTEREMEVALELENAQWLRLFDAMDDAVMVLNADGVVVRANAATVTLSGLRPEDVVGARCCEVVHGRIATHPECPRERALRSGLPETSYIEQDDRLLRVSFKPAPILDGRAGGGVQTVSDVTGLAPLPGSPESGAEPA